MHPAGYPRALAVGRALTFALFIPAIELGGRSAVEIVPKERPRGRVVTPKGGKPFIQWYTDEKTKKWEAHIGELALQQLRSVPIEGDDQDFTLPVRGVRIMAYIRFNMPKPISYPKSVVHMTKKPDLDNLVKAIFDALILARVIEDDSFVTDLHTVKRYADANHPPGVEVELTCLPL